VKIVKSLAKGNGLLLGLTKKHPNQSWEQKSELKNNVEVSHFLFFFFSPDYIIISIFDFFLNDKIDCTVVYEA